MIQGPSATFSNMMMALFFAASKNKLFYIYFFLSVFSVSVHILTDSLEFPILIPKKDALW